jgi:hypothetical protein
LFGAWRRGTLALDRFGVDTERYVVHEHAAVDLGEIHQPLAPVRVRVERSDDVVAVDAEIEREMVTRPRRHTHVRESPIRGDRGDDRLRAVATRNADGIRTVGDRVADMRREVIAEVQLDRLYAARASLACDLEALRLPATRFRVVEQHRPLRRRRGGEPHLDRERAPRGRDREHHPARINRSSSTRPSSATNTTAPASNTPAPAAPPKRAAPRCTNAHHAANNATTKHASTDRPRGNLVRRRPPPRQQTPPTDKRRDRSQPLIHHLTDP